MKTTYQLLIALVMVASMVGCTKYKKDFNLDELSAKQDRLNTQILQRLADAPNGWVIYVPNPDTAVLSATPIILKFDTASRTYTSKSPFPVSNATTPTLFDVSSATGAPLLSFASGSVFSGWNESGGISDFFFKVLNVGQDTIDIQPYRKGQTYQSEGGIPMKMIRLKAPITWFDNPFNLRSLLLSGASPFQKSSVNVLQLTYQNGSAPSSLSMAFFAMGPDDLAFLNAYVPFNRDMKMYPAAVAVNGDPDYFSLYHLGNNSFFSHVDNGFSPGWLFIDLPRAIIKKLKTDHLIVRAVSNDRSKVTVFAVDKNGNEVITGLLEARP